MGIADSLVRFKTYFYSWKVLVNYEQVNLIGKKSQKPTLIIFRFFA